MPRSGSTGSAADRALLPTLSAQPMPWLGCDHREVPPLSRLTFDMATTTTEGPGGSLVVTPEIDGEDLIALVARFEFGKGFTPSGEYGGIVPSHFNLGDLRPYFLGYACRQWPRPGRLWLLGCDCGEIGCWPLEARVIALHDTVTWTDFAQPHRSEWDYAGLGPFSFDRTQYDRAVAWAAEQVATY